MNAPERHLIWFLRFTAVILLAALPAVVMPSAWMRTISVWLGLGGLPELPLVEYLARSLSGLYAMAGVFCWFVSGDVPRYLPLLRFVIPVAVVFGAMLIVLDVVIEMPTGWIVCEAASIVLWTAVYWWLVRAASKPASQAA